MKIDSHRAALVLRKYGSVADRAAKYAHDHSVTRASAARRFGTTTNAVIAAWALLYPTKKRTLT